MRSIAKRLVTTKYAAQSADGKTSYAGSTQGEPLGQSGSGSPGFLRLGHSLPIGQAPPRLFADAARCGGRLMRGSTFCPLPVGAHAAEPATEGDPKIDGYPHRRSVLNVAKRQSVLPPSTSPERLTRAYSPLPFVLSFCIRVCPGGCTVTSYALPGQATPPESRVKQSRVG
jgi:hypothetical protein